MAATSSAAAPEDAHMASAAPPVAVVPGDSAPVAAAYVAAASMAAAPSVMVRIFAPLTVTDEVMVPTLVKSTK